MRTSDYAACARAIFESIGGGEKSGFRRALRHPAASGSGRCAQGRSKTAGKHPGRDGVFCAGGQLQIILGTGTVNRVYEEFIKLSGLPGVPAAQKCTAPVLPLPQRLVKTLGDVFVPILPAIVAAGLLTGILDALGRALPTVAAADWFSFLKMVSGTAFVSLPVLVALSCPGRLGQPLSRRGGGAVHGAPHAAQRMVCGYSGERPGLASALFQRKTSGVSGTRYPGDHGSLAHVPAGAVVPQPRPCGAGSFVTPLCTVLITTFVTFTILGPASPLRKTT